jgi:hypothetical protein
LRPTAPLGTLKSSIRSIRCSRCEPITCRATRPALSSSPQA